MPISQMGDYSARHWSFIKDMLSEIVIDCGFIDPELVSYDEVNPDIKSRIINHIFSIPLLICDVSGNNPNVLYELGMRVAFDMPIIIIKDWKTNFNFDISSFEHVLYPDDIDKLPADDPHLIFFKERMKNKLLAMSKAFEGKSPLVSPLRNYLNHENYLKIKRGAPFDIEGTFEYLCFRERDYYSHGGICHITLKPSHGNLIEWQLKGQRCWIKQSRDEGTVRYLNPYRWDTRKAVIFSDGTFMLNYNIRTDDSNIVGYIKGEVLSNDHSHMINDFVGDYHQDEGKRITKGGFKMVRIPNGVSYNSHEFNFVPS